MLAALHVLAALGSQDGPLSPLLSEYALYQASGEINSEVRDQPDTTQRVKAAFAGTEGVWMDELDGLTVGRDDWWFNLRPSNTEPLLRLNVEAPDEATLIGIRDQVLRIVHGEAD
jgi:phosphomannomutase